MWQIWSMNIPPLFKVSNGGKLPQKLWNHHICVQSQLTWKLGWVIWLRLGLLMQVIGTHITATRRRRKGRKSIAAPATFEADSAIFNVLPFSPICLYSLTPLLLGCCHNQRSDIIVGANLQNLQICLFSLPSSNFLVRMIINRKLADDLEQNDFELRVSLKIILNFCRS